MRRRVAHGSPGSINGILAATSCLRGALFPVPLIQRDAGLDLTPAAVWRLLTEGGECWALLMASASLSGSLSTRGAAEGHCVCWWAGEAHRRVEMLLLTFPKS